VVVGSGNDSFWGVDRVLLVASECKCFRLVIVFGFLSVMIEGPRSEDKVGTQGKGVHPVSVLVQSSDKFSLSDPAV